MLRSQLIMGGVAAGVLGLATVVGCGDSGTGGAGGSAGGVQPKGRPSGAAKGDASGPKALAATKIYIGTTDRSGAASTTAWEQYGYDLDGQITSMDFSHHCKPSSGASPKDIFPDGKDGRDNAFGKKLLPLVLSAAGQGTDIQGSLNKAITDGSFTIIIDLPDLGSGANYDPLSAFLLGGKEGTPMGGPTTWKLVPELLTDGMTATSAKVKFPNSYLNGNTWVSGDKGTVNLSLAIAGFSLNLTISSAVITMDLGGDHNTASNGTIAGVLDTEAFIGELKKVVGAFSTDLCQGGAVESILNQIRQASDIMSDGTQDATKTCNGISIGLGFDASNVTLGPAGTPAMMQPDPCLTTGSTTGATTTSTGTGTSTSTAAGGG